MMTGDDRTTHNKLLLLRTRELDSWRVDALIELSRDKDAGVRDWATFALAARDENCTEVRQALLDRGEDLDFDTRSEAIWGLARRRDERALPLLIAALRGEEVGELFVEAAGFFARPELVTPLLELEDAWDLDPELLKGALTRCRGKPTPDRSWDIIPSNDPDD